MFKRVNVFNYNIFKDYLVFFFQIVPEVSEVSAFNQTFELYNIGGYRIKNKQKKLVSLE